MSRGFYRGEPPKENRSEASPSPGMEGDNAPPALTPALARQMGFTGDVCSNCGGAHMQVAGHCTVCADCGTTTGCS